MFHFQAKLYPYWPTKFPLNCADFIIGKTNMSIYDNFIVRELKIINIKVSATRNLTVSSLLSKFWTTKCHENK